MDRKVLERVQDLFRRIKKRLLENKKRAAAVQYLYNQVMKQERRIQQIQSPRQATVDTRLVAGQWAYSDSDEHWTLAMFESGFDSQ